MIESGKIRDSAASKCPSAATVKIITEHLSDGDWYPDQSYDGIQAFAWPLILQAAGFAATSNTALIITAKRGNEESRSGRIYSMG